MPIAPTLVDAFELLKDFVDPPLWEKVRPYVAQINGMCGSAMDLVVSTSEIVGIHAFFCAPELHFNLTFGKDFIDVVIQPVDDEDDFAHVITWEHLDGVLEALNKTDKNNVLELIEFLESVEI